MSYKLDQHELIAALKNLAIELGRTPTRDEFASHIRSRKAITDAFGSYSTLVQAAGFEPAQAPRITNAIFERDLSTVMSEHVPRPKMPRAPYERTLFIGDTHFPFVSQETLDAIYRRIEVFQPKRIIQVGDLYDLYAHSKFPRSLNIYSPQQEEKLAREGAEEMWKTVRRLAPDAECVQIKGNHDIRPIKRTLECLPALEHVVSRYLDELMSFDGVTLIKDSRQEYFFDDVQVLHGYRSGIGGHRDFAMKNSVHGHTHKGGVSYRRLEGRTIWELDVGFVGDPESKVMGYTPQKTHDCTNGWGEIDELGPRFIAL